MLLAGRMKDKKQAVHKITPGPEIKHFHQFSVLNDQLKQLLDI